jgi:hypothetical protein
VKSQPLASAPPTRKVSWTKKKLRWRSDEHFLQFLTNPRNLVRKLAILKLIAPAPVERGLFGYPTKESYWNSE